MHNFSSRLLGRQLKFAMHLLHMELNGVVLKKLHDTLKGGSKGETSWVESFGAIIILALCGEEQQVSIADWIELRLSGQLKGLRVEGNWKKEREKEWERNKRLDEMISTFEGLFHDVFGSRKRGKGTNPVRDGEEVVGGRMGRGVVEMVGKVRREVLEGVEREEMEALKQPIYNTDVETYMNERIDLADRNPGRLASGFLSSFVS